MYKIYVNHPDDGMIKSIETPWKPELLEACEKLCEKFSSAACWFVDQNIDPDEWPEWMMGSRILLEESDKFIAKAKGEA